MLTFLFIFAVQMKFRSIIHHHLKAKLVTAVFITASLAAFATLGEKGKDGSKASHQKTTLLSTRTYPSDFKHFSLKSGYNYRGSNILSSPVQSRYITLNTSVLTYQKGNSTYILPLKKKVFAGKINFNTTN